MVTPCDTSCGTACRSPFDRVLVTRLLSEGSRITWTLLPSFGDPGPLTFTLLYHNGGHKQADGWEEVGAPVVDQYYAVDVARRDWGSATRARYKVRLETAEGQYESEPVSPLGVLEKRDWLIVREAVRQRKLAYRRGRGRKGYLFKRRITGTPCPTCKDWQTGEPTDSRCPDCYGTGFQCGYYYPQSCVWALFRVHKKRTIKLNPTKGTTAVGTREADILALDFAETGDMWVDAVSDERFIIGEIQDAVEVRGLPVACSVLLSPVGLGSQLYDLVVPDRIGDIL